MRGRREAGGCCERPAGRRTTERERKQAVDEHGGESDGEGGGKPSSGGDPSSDGDPPWEMSSWGEAVWAELESGAPRQSSEE